MGATPQSGAAKAAGKEPAVIAAVGDIACSPSDTNYNVGKGSGLFCRQMATARAAARLDPDRVLVLGDNQYEVGSLADYRTSYDPSWGQFVDRENRTQNLTWPVPGNHEYGNVSPGFSKSLGLGYWAYFNGGTATAPNRTGIAGKLHKGWYEKHTGGWQVLALNSECVWLKGGCGKGSAEYRWLKEKLATDSSQCTLAYWHQPLFTNGLHEGDPLVKPFWELLTKYHAEVVLNGHNHSYERFPRLDANGHRDKSGVRSFVVGTGGKSLYALGRNPGPRSTAGSSTTFGVLKLTLEHSSYSWDFTRAEFTGNGDFADSGSSRCLPN